jgi:subtilisin family serine protease
MLVTACIIAILDSGVRCAGLPCISGYNNTDIINNHGTRVATIAHQTAPECKILPIKFYDKRFVEDDLVAGLDYLIKWKRRKPRARVVANLSLQLRGYTRSLERRIRTLRRLKVPIVAAAGNRSQSHLANIKGVIAVGSLTASGEHTSYTAPAQVYTYARVWGLGSLDEGTSFAAPVVSGILAKVR